MAAAAVPVAVAVSVAVAVTMMAVVVVMVVVARARSGPRTGPRPRSARRNTKRCKCWNVRHTTAPATTTKQRHNHQAASQPRSTDRDRGCRRRSAAARATSWRLCGTAGPWTLEEGGEGGKGGWHESTRRRCITALNLRCVIVDKHTHTPTHAHTRARERVKADNSLRAPKPSKRRQPHMVLALLRPHASGLTSSISSMVASTVCCAFGSFACAASKMSCGSSSASAAHEVQAPRWANETSVCLCVSVSLCLRVCGQGNVRHGSGMKSSKP